MSNDHKNESNQFMFASIQLLTSARDLHVETMAPAEKPRQKYSLAHVLKGGEE